MEQTETPRRRRGPPPSEKTIRKRQLKQEKEELYLKMGISYSIGEACVVLGIDRDTLRKWMRRGILKSGEDYFLTPAKQFRIKASWLKKIAGMPDTGPGG